VRSLLYVAFEIGYIDETEHNQLREKAKFLSGSIANHMNSINNAITYLQNFFTFSLKKSGRLFD